MKYPRLPLSNFEIGGVRLNDLPLDFLIEWTRELSNPQHAFDAVYKTMSFNVGGVTDLISYERVFPVSFEIAWGLDDLYYIVRFQSSDRVERPLPFEHLLGKPKPREASFFRRQPGELRPMFASFTDDAPFWALKDLEFRLPVATTAGRLQRWGKEPALYLPDDGR